MKPSQLVVQHSLDLISGWNGLDGGLRTPQNLRKRALISQENLNTMNHTQVLRELVFGFFAKANE